MAPNPRWEQLERPKDYINYDICRRTPSNTEVGGHNNGSLGRDFPDYNADTTTSSRNRQDLTQTSFGRRQTQYRAPESRRLTPKE